MFPGWELIDGWAGVRENEGRLYPSGPVAQLGARFHGMEEVIGSIPIRSTNHFSSLEAPPFLIAAARSVATRFGYCSPPERPRNVSLSKRIAGEALSIRQ